MADDGLHEIQLNGKQLVFLFMASTVVAVVIFLCGVMVGRGVRAQRPADVAEASADAGVDPTAPAQSSAVSEPPSAAATTSNAPVASNETLTYPSRLEGQDAPEEPLRPQGTAAPKRITTAPAKLEQPAKPVPTSAKVARAEADSGKPQAPTEPAGDGFVVQVAAVNDRGEADSIAKRLASKGYPSFVTTPRNGVPKMFRVRIGKYPTRRQAETIATRLEKEDQFKPWVTR